MSNWYFRDGTKAVDDDIPVGSPEWIRAMGRVEEKLRDFNYKVVRREVLPNGKLVSTVWLGLDHSFTGGKPLIFETMVFPKEDDFGELDMDRYSTEKQAIAGHKRMVKKWKEMT